MNIQIFGNKKCFDTKKAERFFKERGIKFQSIDLLDKGISKGELQSVCRAVGGLDNVIDNGCRDTETLMLIKYLTPDDKFNKVLENTQVLKTPIVRNAQSATIGYQPDVWKLWK